MTWRSSARPDWGAGVVGGGISANLSLKEMAVEASGGGLLSSDFAAKGVFSGSDVHAVLDIQLSGPDIQTGFFSQSQFCAGAGPGLCVKYSSQGGQSGFTISPGYVKGVSVQSGLAYHKSLLGPAPMPGSTNCPRLQ